METNQALLAKMVRALTDGAEGHLLLADGDVRNQQPLQGGLFKYLHPQSLTKLLSSSQHQRSSRPSRKFRNPSPREEPLYRVQNLMHQNAQPQRGVPVPESQPPGAPVLTGTEKLRPPGQTRDGITSCSTAPAEPPETTGGNNRNREIYPELTAAIQAEMLRLNSLGIITLRNENENCPNEENNLKFSSKVKN